MPEQNVIVKKLVRKVIKKKIIKKEVKEEKEEKEEIQKKIIEPEINLTLEEEYLLTLTSKEKETLQIAIEHLKTSFNMEKSVGFCKYKN